MFSLFKRFKEGLKRTANGALGKLAGLFSKKIDPSDIALIEETLIEADFGYETVCEIIDAIKSEYKRDRQLQGAAPRKSERKCLRAYLKVRTARSQRVPIQTRLSFAS